MKRDFALVQMEKLWNLATALCALLRCMMYDQLIDRVIIESCM